MIQIVIMSWRVPRLRVRFGLADLARSGMPPNGRSSARLVQSGPVRRPALHPKASLGKRRPAQELKTRADLFASLSPKSFAAASLLALLKGAQISDQSHQRLRQLARDFVQTLKPATALRQIGSGDPTILDRWLLSQFIPWTATRKASGSESAAESQPRGLGPSFEQLAYLADMRRPQDSWPGARLHQRRIHLHVGPTNSGKTHAALRALHAAHNGAYAGPLRSVHGLSLAPG